MSLYSRIAPTDLGRKRSCHTALLQIQKGFIGTKWFIEGDIVGCFDNIDQHILISLLRKKIHDEYFIALIWKFLRAGYMENWKYKATYSGAAQGSVISPILANIYMHELDKFMEAYKLRFEKGKYRQINLVYNRLASKCVRLKKALTSKGDSLASEEKAKFIEELKETRKQMRTMSSMNPMDENYRRISYTRYADDTLIGVIGSKADAEKVKTDIKNFLADKLNLELSMEKTHVTHATKKARFLGYDVTVAKPSDDVYHKASGQISRFSAGRIRLYVPKDKWLKSLLDKDALWIKKDETGKERWTPVARKDLIYKTPVEIVNIYNSEIRGLYNYYAIANNATVISKFCYVMEYSMYKTLACKFRCSMVKAKKMFTRNGKFSLPYTSAKGENKFVTFYNDGFRKKQMPLGSNVDILPSKSAIGRRHIKPKELIVRLFAGKCELCGETDSLPKIYQVKQLSDLNPMLKHEARMISMRRKTLVLCQKCYDEIHS